MESADEHVIRYRLGRGEWLRTEWPAVLFWFGLAGLTLIVIGWSSVAASAWMVVLVFPWLLFFYRRVVAILGILVRGGETVTVLISRGGKVSVASNDQTPVGADWRGIKNQGETFLLWGGDGRYRVVIPRRALRGSDFEQVRWRMGVDLDRLAVNEEAPLIDFRDRPDVPVGR